MTMHIRDVPLFMEPDGTAAGFYAKRGKRIFDVVALVLLVIVTLPVLVPLVVILLGLVAMDGHSPIYHQKRLGRDGRIYNMLKIRTMVPDAEARLQAHLEADPEARAEWDSLQKLRHDPRITRVGQFLRRSSLDELPQLWNVLIGDMSLVGPRPMLEIQRPMYPGQAYFHLRPGITGLWQVSDRNATTFADRAVFDTEYYATMSLGNDLRLLWSTVSVVLRGTGC